jgi:hypothetical protein
MKCKIEGCKEEAYKCEKCKEHYKISNKKMEKKQ